MIERSTKQLNFKFHNRRDRPHCQYSLRTLKDVPAPLIVGQYDGGTEFDARKGQLCMCMLSTQSAIRFFPTQQNTLGVNLIIYST
jgi:hypothetical protein